MDFGGLALYFLDRLTELNLCSSVPSAVLARLQQNLRDNTERTQNLITESFTIQIISRQRSSLCDIEGVFALSIFGPEVRVA